MCVLSIKVSIRKKSRNVLNSPHTHRGRERICILTFLKGNSSIWNADGFVWDLNSSFLFGSSENNLYNESFSLWQDVLIFVWECRFCCHICQNLQKPFDWKCTIRETSVNHTLDQLNYYFFFLVAERWVIVNVSIFEGGARGVMVIVVGNGHGDESSNPGRDW